jgi:hypothetical protein
VVTVITMQLGKSPQRWKDRLARRAHGEEAAQAAIKKGNAIEK